MKRKNILLLLVLSVLIFSCKSSPEGENESNTDNTTEQKQGDIVDIEAEAKNPGNPVITDKYTADPAALVYNDTVYLYVGHDEAALDFHFYTLNEWLIYKSTDMVNWTEHSEAFPVSTFKWAKGAAWAAQVAEKNGKFYWYVTCDHATIPGMAIGVAVSESPTGPFVDALGKALITNDMTKDVEITWDDIDPTIWIEDNGDAYMYWGNTSLKYVKLKENMIEVDGDIEYIELPNFVEAPWIHKKNDWYYLTYSYGFPEKTAYAMSKSITGPWEFKGIINEIAGNCNTNHQSIITYKGKDYFIYHNGSIQPHGCSFRRSVCIDYLFYNKDNTIKKIQMTSSGISPAL